jgi:dethiobiotin synthetase
MAMNLLVLPGLGSLLARRRTAGLGQVAVALAGASLSLWWFAQLLRQWAEDGSIPGDGGEHFAVGIAGVLVFGVAWLWSLGTSLVVVRTARASNPRVKSPRDTETQRTERESTEERREPRESVANAFLVTGTDTGVGKTVVAAALVMALRARGRDAVGFKPVETGVEPGVVTDSALLARASGSDDPRARPFLSLREPLAPALAAERAGQAVDPREIEARVRALRARHAAIVVEGAGGVAVPLAWEYTVLDLASACALQAIIVARPGLGTLNHIWLTVEALRTRGIPVTAVILNGASPAGDLAEATNPAALARMLPGVRCLSLPRQDASDPWDVAQRLAPLLASLIKV